MANVKVKAMTAVKDNGIVHQKGETFEMEHSLVDPHVKAGQVQLDSKSKVQKMKKTPSNKQATSPESK